MCEELAQIRERGYATDQAEEFEGCHCVGTVIRDHRNYPIAMIWATGSSFNLSIDRFDDVGQQVKQTADTISRKFGYQLP